MDSLNSASQIPILADSLWGLTRMLRGVFEHRNVMAQEIMARILRNMMMNQWIEPAQFPAI